MLNGERLETTEEALVPSETVPGTRSVPWVRKIWSATVSELAPVRAITEVESPLLSKTPFKENEAPPNANLAEKVPVLPAVRAIVPEFGCEKGEAWISP